MEDQLVHSSTSLNLISNATPQGLESNSRAAHSRKLRRFFQLQVDQLVTQSPIKWAQIVYYDPISVPHRQVVQASDRSKSSAESPRNTTSEKPASEGCRFFDDYYH